jgi:outer membrane lipoprotein SlyB
MDTAQGGTRRLHPVLWVAAVAVTLFSAVGIGAILGIIPVAGSKTPDAVATTVPASVGQPAESLPSDRPDMPGAALAQIVSTSDQPASPPSRSSGANSGRTVVAERAEVMAERPAPMLARDECRSCGVIESVRTVEKKGEGTGLGAVAGGVLGGVLGHQVGGGRGQDVATVLGAVGGAYGGHQVEKSARATTIYRITVRFEDGSSQVFTQRTAPAWQKGDHVRVIDGAIRPD